MSATATLRPTTDSPARAVAEASGIFAVMVAVAWAVRSLPQAGEWQARTFGAPVLTALAAHLVVALLAIVVLRLDPARLGVVGHQPRRWAEVSCVSLGVVGTIGGAGFAVASALPGGILGLAGSAVLVIAYAVAIPALAWALRSTRVVDAATGPGALRGVVAVLLGAGVVAWLATPSAPLVARTAYLLVVVGLGEELFYRGLLQGRLDTGLGRPWQVLGVRLGWGWPIQAALFGLAHVLMAPEPSAALGWGVWTAVAGLAFGWLRARAGTILAPALVHGIVDTIGLALLPAMLA